MSGWPLTISRRRGCSSLARFAGLFLLLCAAVGFLAWHWTKPWQTDAAREAELADAGALFAGGQVEQALARLTEPPLHSAEAQFARAAILAYTPVVDLNRAGVTPLLRMAADRGYPPAQILLGWALQLDPTCADCWREARRWFKRALRYDEDRDARLGLALSWSSEGNFQEMNRHLEVLLAEPVLDEIRVLALAFRTPDIDPGEKAVFFRESAEQGWAEAQLQYATGYLDVESDEARLWIAMAAAQGHARAIVTAEALRIPQTTRSEAERRLLDMASDPALAIGKAAEWCTRLKSDSEIERCRLRALENHLSCRLPKSTTDALGIEQFDGTEVYSGCRHRQLSLS